MAYPSPRSKHSQGKNDSDSNYYFLLNAARACAAISIGAVVVALVCMSLSAGFVFGAIALVAAVSCWGLFKTAQNQCQHEPQSLIPTCCFE
jgi:hypothetical protein